jgi:hypothetical protein
MSFFNSSDANNYQLGTAGFTAHPGFNVTLKSDIVQVSGVNLNSGSNYVLQLTYSPTLAAGETDPLDFFLVGYNATYGWVNAISGDTGFGANLLNYQGPWQAGQGQDGNFYYDTAYNASLDVLGNYGTYLNNGVYTAWAVVDYSGDFSSIPEPATWGMIIGGFGMLMGIQKLRKRRVGT